MFNSTCTDVSSCEFHEIDSLFYHYQLGVMYYESNKSLIKTTHDETKRSHFPLCHSYS